ncbi:sporulation and cell division repeat family protein [Neisseria sp. oral taxon 014 str. F0314]|uniref:hypothetical protein n=1 Tax=Neisseria sp. oral taxon 014 TaxID=641148 RepID=UPI0001D8CF55|nr:hypothetical protein [Neisseria sp. oral taxon 014]EFI23137.1 sporulation and cell division repeat family protein [Neisseria sp. oral taxon 014 str. F0314]
MKWLFALLVALNLIVFGGMVAYRMTVKQNQTVVQASAPLEGGTHELARPESLTPKSTTPASAPDSVPEWVAQSESNAAVAERKTEKTEESQAVERRVENEQDKKVREEQEAKAKEKEKEKKEREEKLKREKERKEKAAENQNTASEEGKPAQQQCSTATVVIDEDDYHRIKGLLGRWPHAATRSVEKRTPKKSAQKPSKNYRVLISTGGDAVAQLENLNAKGFSGTLHNGEISVGVTHSRSAAQIIISRLSSANIGGARIVEDEEGGGTSDGALSVARMHITFMSVDGRMAQDINNVVGRYGKLNVKNCK